MEKNLFFDKHNVSRETMNCLENYVDLLIKWNQSINLISKHTINQIWDRHVLDSAQLVRFIDKDVRKWVDLGSGAGFPGLIVASIVKDSIPKLCVSLVESDQRKCVFLRQAADLLKVNVEIFAGRVQDCSFKNADIISARALAPIKKLLPYFIQIGKIKGAKALFLKGKNINRELQDVEDLEQFNIKTYPSLVDESGFVLEVEKR